MQNISSDETKNVFPKKQSSFWRNFALACLFFCIVGAIGLGILGYWGYQKIRELKISDRVENLGSSLKNQVTNSIQGATGSGNLGVDLLSYTHTLSLNGAINQKKTITVSGTKLYILVTAEDVTGSNSGTALLRDSRGAQIGETIFLSKDSALSKQLHQLGGSSTNTLAAGDAKYTVAPGTYTIEVAVKGIWNVQVLSDQEVKE